MNNEEEHVTGTLIADIIAIQTLERLHETGIANPISGDGITLGAKLWPNS